MKKFIGLLMLGWCCTTFTACEFGDSIGTPNGEENLSNLYLQSRTEESVSYNLGSNVVSIKSTISNVFTYEENRVVREVLDYAAQQYNGGEVVHSQTHHEEVNYSWNGLACTQEWQSGNVVEEYLDDLGFSKKEIKTAKKALEATEEMVDTLGEGKYSVWSAVSIISFCGDAKILFENEDSFWYDDEAIEVIGYLQLIFGIIVGVFALTGLLMILAIVSHIRDKKGLGISAVFFSVLLLLAFGFLHLAMNIDESVGGITLAPVLTTVFAIASCIAWAGARKQIAK